MSAKILPFKTSKKLDDLADDSISETMTWPLMFFSSMSNKNDVSFSCIQIIGRKTERGNIYQFIPMAVVEYDSTCAFYLYDTDTNLFHLEILLSLDADEDDDNSNSYFIAERTLLESFAGFGDVSIIPVMSNDA